MGRLKATALQTIGDQGFDLGAETRSTSAVGPAMRFAALNAAEEAFALTNEQGDYAIVSADERARLLSGTFNNASDRYRDLEARGLTTTQRSPALQRLDKAVSRTRKAFLLEGPTLHIFVVTLRCDHGCQYCQVSRANVSAAGFDMSPATAMAAVYRLFEAPSDTLTVEFQGGEPALRFDLIISIVEEIGRRNELADRSIRFSLVSTLHHLTDEQLVFCREHGIHISTSVDGPAALHDRQRPLVGGSSADRTRVALARARATLGAEGVAALATITRSALVQPRAIVDSYRELGFSSIFLRPISPYGYRRSASAPGAAGRVRFRSYGRASQGI